MENHISNIPWIITNMIICKMNEMVQWWIVKWCYSGIKYVKEIRTHRNNSSSQDREHNVRMIHVIIFEDIENICMFHWFCTYLFQWEVGFQNCLWICFCCDRLLFTLLYIHFYYFSPLLREIFFFVSDATIFLFASQRTSKSPY